MSKYIPSVYKEVGLHGYIVAQPKPRKTVPVRVGRDRRFLTNYGHTFDLDATGKSKQHRGVDVCRFCLQPRFAVEAKTCRAASRRAFFSARRVHKSATT